MWFALNKLVSLYAVCYNLSTTNIVLVYDDCGASLHFETLFKAPSVSVRVSGAHVLHRCCECLVYVEKSKETSLLSLVLIPANNESIAPPGFQFIGTRLTLS